MTPRPCEGDPTWWDSISTTIDQARFSVWSVPDDQYDTTTAECVDQVAKHAPETVARYLDVGCGIGRMLIPMAHRYPSAEGVGYDVSSGMLKLCYEEVQRAKVDDRVVCTAGDGTTLNVGGFDLAYSVVVLQHNNRRVVGDLIRSVAGALAPGGRFVYQLVGSTVIHDEGHIPEGVAREWATDAGLEVVAVEHGVVFGDWLWVIAERAA